VRGRGRRDGAHLVHVETRRGCTRRARGRPAALLRHAAVSGAAGIRSAASRARLGAARRAAGRAATARAAHRSAAVASSHMGAEIRPFRVEVSEADLDDLRERLARTRWPDQIPGSGWDYGTDLRYLQDLCDTWRTKFDWRAQEDR